MIKSNTVIIITGATASGKTAISLRLASLIGGEIVCCDSMQIYQTMDIGTAKPTQNERNLVRHHMLDVVTADESYSVAEYQASAYTAIEDILSRGRTPIVVGGTGLYVSSLLYKMSFATRDDSQIRQRLQDELAEMGAESMYRKLQGISPEVAQSIHMNNTRRVIRALEIMECGGNKTNDEKQLNEKYDFRLIVTEMERPILYERIDKRVEEMFANGLESEVRNLLNKGYSFDSQAMQAIGYKEFALYISGQIGLDEVKELIKRHTRNYAKRQQTWFKQYDFANRINPYEVNELSDEEFLKRIICDER